MAPPPSESAPLSRDELGCSTARVLRAARGAKPAILLVERAGRRLIVKDFAGSPWLIRQTYGRWIVGNESRIYARLGGVAGVPAFRGRLDAFAFAVDYVDGRTLKSHHRRSLPAAVFERLAAVQAALHERGVVHLDSHQRKNVLVTADGEPHLVDFATALYLGTGWVARRVLVPLLGGADRLGLHKLRVRYCAEPLPPPSARRHGLLWAVGWLWPHTAVRRLRRIIRRWRRRRALRADPRSGPGARKE